MKNTMKKMVALLMAMMMLLGFAACKNKSEDAAAPETTVAADTANADAAKQDKAQKKDTEKKDTKEDAAKKTANPYDSILKAYQSAVSGKLGREAMGDKGLNYLAADGTLDNIYYSMVDLDKNGTEELILTTKQSTFDAAKSISSIIDIYTIQDGKPVLVVRAGERDRYYIAADNCIYNEGSNSAFESTATKYVLKGAKLVQVQKVELLYAKDETGTNKFIVTTKDGKKNASEEEALKICSDWYGSYINLKGTQLRTYGK